VAKDYYAVLGIPKTASESEIKQAYRKLSKELHPDKHPSTGSGQAKKDAEAKFKEVNEAYEVLSDPKKKQAYDRFGSADFSGFGQGGGAGGGGFSGFGGFDPSQFENMGFGDIFESFFGGAGGGRRRKADNRGRNIEVEITIPFGEAVRGSERNLELGSLAECPECKGSGAEPGSKLVECKECGGTGSVTQTSRTLFGMIRQNVVCPTCHGSGKVPEKTCKKCRGEGRVQQKRTIVVRIPAGIAEGQTLRVTGEGEAGRQGATAGDLLVHIHVEPDPNFERDGDDIRSTLSMPLIDAVLGAEKDVETVHGKTTVHIPAGTQPGQILRLKGKGMPIVNSGKHGDHYLTIDVAVPTKLTREQRKLFEELKKNS
jgi:molecular chaperone DnaJ